MKNKKNKELFIYSCSSIVLIITLIIMVFILEYISTKEQNINKEEQEQKVQNIELVIPEQNKYGTIEIYDSEGNVMQTMAHGEIKIVNDGKNGEPIKILMCAGKEQKVEQSK